MRGLMEIYRRFFHQYRVALFTSMLLLALFSLEPYAMGAFTKYLVDDVLQIEAGSVAATDGSQALTSPREVLTKAQKVHRLMLVAGCMAVIHLLAVGGNWWSWYSVAMASEKSVFHMRRRLFERLQRLQMLFHDQRQTGRLMSRVIDDVRIMQFRFSPTMMQTARAITGIVTGLVLVIYIQPKLGVVALLTVPAYAALMFRYLPTLKWEIRGVRQINSTLYGLVRDRLTKPRVIKAFRQERREHLRMHRLGTEMLRKQMANHLTSARLWGSVGFIAAVGTAVAMGWGVQMVRQGTMTLGELLFFHGTLVMLFSPVVQLADLTGQWQYLSVVSERVCDILNEPITIADREGSHALVDCKGSIRLEGVDLQYDGSQRKALVGINMKIRPGTKVAVMGHSGSGKSSLASLILRLYDPTAGVIKIDGVPLDEIKRTSLRKLVSYVPQEPVIFSGTLGDNIAYGALDVTTEKVVAAAKAAEIHEFIESLPGQYDTEVGERGLTLSGGQKQRISLARAMIHDPRILVLDDCTSALDAHTEARIQRTLRFAMGDRTTLIITHRASMAARCDCVVVLDHGRIVEQGTHEDLLALEGHYWRLVRDQLAEADRVHAEQGEDGAA